MDQVGKTSGQDQTLIINAGNNFKNEARDNQIAQKYILAALAACGVEVMGPGPQDFVSGEAQLKALKKGLPIHMVSANLPGFEPYVCLDKNGGNVKVLVTSFVDPALMSQYPELKEPGDPAEALRRIEREVAHDLFIVIVHAEDQGIFSIVDACPGIDLVIDGQSKSLTEEGAMDNTPTVVSNNQKGMYVSYVDYLGNEIPDYKFSDPTNLRTTVGEIEEHSQIVQLVQQYNQASRDFFKSQERNIKPDAVLYSDNSPYSGRESCNQCHTEISDNWRKTRHAVAMESLVGKRKEYDPDCLSCHVTGIKDLQQVGGYIPMDKNIKMAGVQCEACHGPGAGHVDDPLSVKMQPINENTCTRCHTAEKDPKFNYKRDYVKVNHDSKEVVGLFSPR